MYRYLATFCICKTMTQLRSGPISHDGGAGVSGSCTSMIVSVIGLMVIELYRTHDHRVTANIFSISTISLSIA